VRPKLLATKVSGHGLIQVICESAAAAARQGRAAAASVTWRPATTLTLPFAATEAAAKKERNRHA